MANSADLAKFLGFDPNATQAVPAVAPAAPTAAPVAQDDGPSTLAQALIGLAPILGGAIFGGARGGAIGAEAGLSGLRTLEASREKQEAKREKQKEREQELQKEREKLAIQAKTELNKDLRAQEAERRKEAIEFSKLGIEKEKLNLERQKALKEGGSSKKALEQLPIENKVLVEKLSDDSAKKQAIANEIEKTITIFDDPKISEDQKIVAGQSLLKVLNSTQGADAVGVEEAQRLGGLLEYKIFNPTGPGSFFGRDIPEFRNQTALTVNRLRDAVDSNRQMIQQAMSGQTPQAGRVPLIETKRGASGTTEAVAGPMSDRQKRIMELRQALGK